MCAGCLSLSSFLYLSVSLCFCPCICLSVGLSLSVSVFLCLFVSVSLSVSLSLFLTLSLSLSLSLSSPLPSLPALSPTFVTFLSITVSVCPPFSYRGFPTRMMYLYYLSCLRYIILAGNPQYMCIITYNDCFVCIITCYLYYYYWLCTTMYRQLETKVWELNSTSRKLRLSTSTSSTMQPVVTSKMCEVSVAGHLPDAHMVPFSL